MPTYLQASKFRSDSRPPLWYKEGLREFSIALAMLALALWLALMSQSAAQRGDNRSGFAFSLASLLLVLITAITVVPRLARKTILFRRLLPFPFRITRAGGVYLLGIFLIGLAAINTGNNLLFLMLAAFLSSLIVSGIAACTSLRSISVSVQVPENVFEGEKVFLKVSFRNQKRYFPAFSISVGDLEMAETPAPVVKASRFTFWRSGRQPRSSTVSRSLLRQSAYFPMVLPGRTQIELVAQIFPKRGQYRLEGFQLSTRFPFGFFRHTESVRAGGEVVVYPSIHELSGIFHLLPFLPGPIEGTRAGQGESLYAIRKYQGGDNARRVDWKATAKTGELMAREYARDEEIKFCLILDTLIHGPQRDGSLEEFEKAVRLAASLAVHFIGEGAELEFLTPFEYLPHSTGTSHLYRILHSLALVSCIPDQEDASPDLCGELSGMVAPSQLQQILSDKLFKIIISSKPRGSFTSAVWRSSRVIYFDEI